MCVGFITDVREHLHVTLCKSPKVTESNDDVARIFELLERKFWLPEKPLGAFQT